MTGTAVWESGLALDLAIMRGTALGILDAAVMEKMREDAVKGILQIAHVIGTSHLRDDLQEGFDVMRHLVSLGLETSGAGNPVVWAELLASNGLLSLSRSGSALLKEVYALPDSAEFRPERNKAGSYSAEFLLAWSGKTYSEIVSEKERRKANRRHIDAVLWLLRVAGHGRQPEASEPIIPYAGTALLALTAGAPWPSSQAEMVAIFEDVRKRKEIRMPSDVPDRYVEPITRVVDTCRAHVLPRLRQAGIEKRWLNDHPKDNPLIGFVEIPAVAAGDVELNDSRIAKEWIRLVGERHGKKALRSILMCVALDLAPRPNLVERDFRVALAAIQGGGLDDMAVEHFIAEHVPHEQRSDVHEEWWEFRESVNAIADHDTAAVMKWLGNRVEKHRAGTSRNMTMSRVKRRRTTTDN